MKFFGLFLLTLIVASCGVKREITKQINALEDDFQHHAGIAIYDTEKEAFVIEQKADRYFTPASNTKILTLYASAVLLGDSIPGLYYTIKNDSLIFWGSGDPGLLNNTLPQSAVYAFLKSTKKDLYLSTSNFKDKHLGPGWSWDDYLYKFSSQRSSLPVYGNSLTIRKQRDSTHLTLDVPYFKRFFTLGDSIERPRVTRAIGTNEILYEPSLHNQAFKRELPFNATPATIASLLSDTLNRPVKLIKKPLPINKSIIRSMPTDSALKVMMQQSDNFIAEQLLLVCAGILGDSLKADIAINWAKDSLLAEAPDEIIWVDGSGLSRYNLITPRTTVWLWQKLLEKMGKERLFQLIATGGEPGTLMSYYRSDEPYMFGKTGTLSNNHNLSGFMLTKSGKLLIFSFMNNNYPTESRAIKLRMEQILNNLHQNY